MEDFPEEFDLHNWLLYLWIRLAFYDESTLKVNRRDSYVMVYRGQT